MSNTHLANSIFLCSSAGKLFYTSKDLGKIQLDILKIIADFASVGGEPVSTQRIADGTLEMEKVHQNGFNGIVAVYSWQTTSEEHIRITELQEKLLELEGVFETSLDGFVVADGKGIFRRVNSSYERISGLKREKILGFSGKELVIAGLISHSATEIVLNTGKVASIDQGFPNSHQRSYITANPLFNDKGEIFRIVTNVRDITELHVLRNKLVKSQEDLDNCSRLVKNLTQKPTSLVFRSAAMRQIKDTSLRLSQINSPILVFGDTGVGKEVIADFIHNNSPRMNKPFLKINCASIPEHLLEAELFGFTGGAFTGANKEGSLGLFEMANQGTVLLDEVGEMPMVLQAKLLRFVETQEFYRVGGRKPVKVNVRLLAATNRNLEEMIATKTFRMDLFYRLAAFCINIPPLCKRREDIIPLALHFLKKSTERHGLARSFDPAIFEALYNYSWPGNVRELAHLIERLVIMSDSSVIAPEFLPNNMRIESRSSRGGPQQKIQPSFSDTLPGPLGYLALENRRSVDIMELTYNEAKEEFERAFWNRVQNPYLSYRQIAKKLQVTHVTVMKKIRRYGGE